MYIIRLDDASIKMDVKKWTRMENILDKYGVKPIVGVIPNNEDESMLIYESDLNFWNKAKKWQDKGWHIALHGYNHVYLTKEGGINPVNYRSEFAGVSLEIQKEKISKGMEIMNKNGLNPKIFFAPSHTFDENTIEALKQCSEIKIISDTIANKPYRKYGMTFYPQQSGKVRKLPFKVVTFCYHPNIMSENDFVHLENFLQKNKNKFINVEIKECKRKSSIYDALLKKIYFFRRKRNG